MVKKVVTLCGLVLLFVTGMANAACHLVPHYTEEGILYYETECYAEYYTYLNHEDVWSLYNNGDRVMIHSTLVNGNLVQDQWYVIPYNDTTTYQNFLNQSGWSVDWYVVNGYLYLFP